MTSSSFYIIDISYTFDRKSNQPSIYLAVKDSATYKPLLLQIKGFQPYFYVEDSKKSERILLDNSKVNNWVVSSQKEIRVDYQGGQNKKVLKLNGSNPSILPMVKAEFLSEGVHCFEFDMLFIKRFLLDLGMRCFNSVSINIITQDNSNVLEIDYSDFKRNLSFDHSINFEPIYLAFDIEVDSKDITFAELFEEKKRRLTAISLAYGKANEIPKLESMILKEDSNLAESDLIIQFCRRVVELAPDVIVGYNSDEFDFPYLLSRMEKLGIKKTQISPYGKRWNIQQSFNKRNYYLFGIAITDLAKKAWGIHPPSGTKSLDDIASYLLGEKKLDFGNPGDLWHDAKIQELIEYCQKDAELTFKLLKPLGVPEWLEAVKVVGMPPGEGINTTARNLGEFEVFRTCVQKNVLFPPLPSKREIRQRRIQKEKFPHEGALVLEPKGSIYSNVAIFDFTSMYPSLMISFNIGGESLKASSNKKSSITPEKMFKLETETCLSATMKVILDKRLEIKSLINNEDTLNILEDEKVSLDRRQKALKIILNSTIGSHNYPGSRFFNGVIANAIFSLGRNQLKTVKKFLKEYAKLEEKAKVIYGDTDSAFVCFRQGNFIEELYHSTETNHVEKRSQALIRVTKLLDFLNEKFPGIMKLELEDLAYRVIFKPGRRKAYAFISALSKVKTLKIKGFEAIRSDWSLVAKETQKLVLNALLREPLENQQNVLKAKEITIQQCLKILTLPLNKLKKEIQILSPIRKRPSKYRAPTPVVGAFFHFCQHNNLDPEEHWKDFDRFPWIIITGSSSLWERSRHPDYATNIDRLHYIRESISVATRFGVKVEIGDIAKRSRKGPLDKYL